MKLVCDECKYYYDSNFDSHEIGEPNWCCEACAWENSRSLDEPKPPHSCTAYEPVEHYCEDCQKHWYVEMRIIGRGGLISLHSYAGASTSICPSCKSKKTKTISSS